MRDNDATVTSAGESRAEERTARLWLAACAAITAIIALLSTGAYHDDDLKHYLFARWTRYDPEYFTHIWGRPGFTLLYALPAQFGWWACRLTSVALSGVAAWATFRSAKRLGLRRPAWAIPLIYALPLFLHLSTTTLTETPTATYLALTTWALLVGRTHTSAALFSLALITRHEAIILVPIWAWAITQEAHFSLPPSIREGRARATLREGFALARRHWSAFALLLWAPAVYNVATLLAFGYLPSAVFSRPAGAIHYGHGTPLTFLMRFIVMAGPIAATLFIVGCRALWPAGRARPLVVGVVAYVAAETALYMLQAYATGGYARFLVPLAPWVAIIALAGANAVLDATWQIEPLRADEHKQTMPSTLWLVAAAALWSGVEIEQAVNPIAAIVPYFWLFRLAAVVLLAGIAAGIVHWNGRRFCGVVVALALVGPVGRAAWPHRLRPREAVIAETVAALRASNLLGRPFYSTSDWSYYFATHWYTAQHPPLYDQLGVAPPVSLLIWEEHYGPSPHFHLQLEALPQDPR